MTVEGQIVFPAPRRDVWTVLLSREALERAVPGCESLTETAPDEYDAQLKLGVAAVKGSYKAQVKVTDKRPEEGYRLVISGSGGPGFVNVEGTLDLVPQGDQTRVDYHFDVQAGGMIAAVGQRMLGGVAKMMMGEFFKNMQQQLPGAAGGQ